MWVLECAVRLCRGCHWPYLNAVIWNSSFLNVTLCFLLQRKKAKVVTVGVSHSWMFLVLLHCSCGAYNPSDTFLYFNLSANIWFFEYRRPSVDQVRSNYFSFQTLSFTCTMSQAAGKLEEFDVTTCDDDTYFEHLDCYFVANNIPEAAKVSTFISLAGPKTYKLFKSLVSPGKASDKTVDELKQILKTHVQPTESLISRRVKFRYSWKQRTNESNTDYVAALKLLAAEREFGNFLNDALRGIFSIGTADVETQKKLRADKTPSFVEAVKLALARETLSWDMQGLAAPPANGMHKIHQPRPHSTIVPAHRTQQTIARGRFHFCFKGRWTNRGRNSLPKQSAATTGARKCHRCGREDHDSRNCRFKSYEYRNCGKKGHLQAMCRSRGATWYLEMEEEKWEREERDEQEEENDTYAQKLEGLAGDLPQQKQGP